MSGVSQAPTGPTPPRGSRIGLTGGLGSGKSTVARMLAVHGAFILSADEIGRQLMQPGEQVFAQIVQTFGPGVVLPDGTLNRPELARLAFTEGRLDDLNAIVHPATIARQNALTEDIFARDPTAIVVTESALIFETKYGEAVHTESQPWRTRFDKLVLVTAPEAEKISRYIARSGSTNPEALAAEARRRLAQQIPDETKAPQVDFIVENDADLAALQQKVDRLWHQLRA